MLVEYTTEMLSQKKAYNRKPSLTLRPNGIFYFSKSAINKMEAKQYVDHLLFTQNDKTKEWYVSIDNQKGLMIRAYNNSNGASYITSSTLRKYILLSLSDSIKEVKPSDVFYFDMETLPEYFEKYGGRKFFKIRLRNGI
ncbi:MAG: hypothetical protein HOP11_03550 [Saprospiraceae bacterium]|nr:hypothetical protein [Saprospiraceae bacterium]